MSNWDSYLHCPMCQAVLLKDKLGNIVCKLCGWAHREKSDNEETPSYIG